MKKILCLLLLLTVALQENEITGTYSYGDGYGFEFMTLSVDKEVTVSQFTDGGGRSGKRTIATYTVAGDSLKLNYLAPKWERRYSERFGHFFIIREHEDFRALLPPAEAANWESHLADYEDLKKKARGKIPDSVKSKFFSSYKIYVLVK